MCRCASPAVQPHQASRLQLRPQHGCRHVATVVGFMPCGPASRSTVSPRGSRFMGVVAPAPRRCRRIRWRRGRRREPARRGATRGTRALPATLSPRRERLNQGALLLCDRCGEIDNQTGYYRELARSTTDKGALAAIDSLIAKPEAEKLALHWPGAVFGHCSMICVRCLIVSRMRGRW
jgi:hypothetical protein